MVLNVTSLPAVVPITAFIKQALAAVVAVAPVTAAAVAVASTTSLVLGKTPSLWTAVGFDRSVKIEFDSDAVEYDALSVNGAARTIGADASEVPSVSINGSTLTWTEADGTTLQFSDDLESWTSLHQQLAPTPLQRPLIVSTERSAREEE